LREYHLADHLHGGASGELADDSVAWEGRLDGGGRRHVGEEVGKIGQQAQEKDRLARVQESNAVGAGPSGP